MANVKTDYIDYALKPVASGNPKQLRKFNTYNSTTGELQSTIYVEDVTDYQTVGSNILASDLNILGNAVNLNSANFASGYSPSSTYTVGAYCTYQNILYKCTTAITTPEAWTPAHWTIANVMGELLKAIVVRVSETVDANDTTKIINVPTPTGITTLIGAPIVSVAGSVTINNLTTIIPLNDNRVRVISTVNQTVEISRLFIGY